MKICSKISLFLMIAFLSVKTLLSFSDGLYNKTNVVSHSISSEINHHNSRLKEYKNLVSDILLAEEIEEEEEKKKLKYKSLSGTNKSANKLTLLLKFAHVEKVGDQIIKFYIPLYKLYHSWKTDLL